MNQFSMYTSIAYDIWGVLAIVWLIFTFTNKRTARRESFGGQILVLVLLIVGYGIVFDRRLPAFLNQFSFPVTPIVGWLGVLLVAAGAALAIWARFVIGRNWSGAGITLKENHELVQRGAYSVVRHPIYSGLLLAGLGIVVTTGYLFGLVGLIFVTIAFLIRIPKEEMLMTEQFPAEYPNYKQRVKALIPFIY